MITITFLYFKFKSLYLHIGVARCVFSESLFLTLRLPRLNFLKICLDALNTEFLCFTDLFTIFRLGILTKD